MSTGWYGERTRWSKASALREFLESDGLSKESGWGALSAKIVANNTLLIMMRDGRMILRLHKTNILTRIPGSGDVRLDSGGWLTNTTKNRICEFLPKFLDEHAPRVYIGSDRGVWKLSNFRYLGNDPTHTFISIFYDGMVLGPMGDVHDPRPDIDAETKKIRKQIASFCKMVKEWQGALPVPDIGDCIPCRVESEHPGEWSSDHVRSHLEEPYLHGTLIWNALKMKGYREDQMPFVFGIKDIVVRALRVYFKKRLGLAVA